MRILIIGGGGREHALAHTYSKSSTVTKVIVAPGNDFMEETSSKIEIKPTISVFDFDEIIKLVKKEKVDFVDVAQDDPLAAGLVDRLQKEHIRTFGPTQKQSEIEWNKTWSRDFMKKYHLPIPHFKSFSDQKKAIAYISALPEQPLFIKASGLAAGKGALKAENKRQAIDAVVAMKLFGKAGATFLIEECMVGEEFSLFALCDGKNYTILQTAQDHKTVNNKDQGPNTGGMGCVSPTSALSKAAVKEVEKKILKPFMIGMEKEHRPYTGILYVGGMLTKKNVNIVEFNARWGDPEAEVILPGIITNYLSLIKATLTNSLKKIGIQNDGKIRVSVTGCAYGYPGAIGGAKGKQIVGLEKVMEMKHITIFGAGMKRIGKHYVANGGRLFHLVAEGRTITEARERAYGAISHIYIADNNLHYRTDIGWREMARDIKK